MLPEQWAALQVQLWSAFHPLVYWFLTFLLVGMIAAALFLFGATYFTEWLDG
jgi:hypothetical protein